jgi:hypothetical protein
MDNKISMITIYIGLIITVFGVITFLIKKANYDKNISKLKYFSNTYLPIALGLLCVGVGIKGISILVVIKKVVMHFLAFFTLFMERL